MNWKELLRPNKKKLIISILIILSFPIPRFYGTSLIGYIALILVFQGFSIFPSDFFNIGLFYIPLFLWSYFISCLFVFRLSDKNLNKLINLLVIFMIITSIWGFFPIFIQIWDVLFHNQSTFYQLEVTDSFCTGGNQATIVIRNQGTAPFSPKSEVTIVNANTGVEITDVDWSTAEGVDLGTGNLEPGKLAKASMNCTSGTLCVYRVTSASTGRSLRAAVQC